MLCILLSAMVGWLWSRINNVQTEAHRDRDNVLEEVDALRADFNRLKVELPTNYATKDDLVVVKSDILSEIRELRTLNKEIMAEIRALMTLPEGSKG